MQIKMKLFRQITKINPAKLMRNIKLLMATDYNQSIIEIHQKMDDIKGSLKNEIFRIKVLSYYKEHPESALNFKEELLFLEQNGDEPIAFPYKQVKKLENIESGYDKKRRLPYVIHKGKRLYFPKEWNMIQVTKLYKYYIENEGFTGEKHRVKMPHQYQTESFCVKQGDVVLDIGCCEALFALDVIDVAKKIYLVECDPCWIDALNATFAPYKEKVKIIHKLVSDTDSETSITLPSILTEEQNASLFIKMDIEGYETSVINASKELLSKAENIRLACCTYHKEHDAEILSNVFTELNYKTEFSDGYILFIYGQELKAPFFRKAIIRAEKNNR